MRFNSIFAGVLAFLFMSMVPGRGHLKFDESFKDLGSIKQGGIETFSFSYSNTGDKKVRISSVTALSSGVKIVPIKDSIIDVNADAEIKIEFDTNKHAKGDFAFGVTVNSNADNKEVKLKLFGVLE